MIKLADYNKRCILKCIEQLIDSGKCKEIHLLEPGILIVKGLINSVTFDIETGKIYKSSCAQRVSLMEACDEVVACIQS